METKSQKYEFGEPLTSLAERVDYPSVLFAKIGMILMQPLGKVTRLAQIEDLDDLLWPFHDDELKRDLEKLESEKGEWERNGRGAEWDRAYQRGYFRALMALMDRKNLLGEREIL
jgi:hypothetical protein